MRRGRLLRLCRRRPQREGSLCALTVPVRFWKVNREHPLLYHLLDVAACCESTLTHNPRRLERAAALLNVDPDTLARTTVALAALHGLGKATCGFQGKAVHLWPAALMGPVSAEVPPQRHNTWLLIRF